MIFSAFNTSEPTVAASTTDKSIAIQIEVDIEPPADTDGLDGDELARLGLPAHHVHYRAGQPAGSELLAPEDIQVSYTLKEEEEEENGPEPNIVDMQVSRRRSLQRRRPQRLQSSGGKAETSLLLSPDRGNEEIIVDPPRALPAREDGFSAVTAAVEAALAERLDGRSDVEEKEWTTTTRPTQLFSQRMGGNDDTTVAAIAKVEPALAEGEDDELADGIYGVPAFCGLDCGNSGGTCYMSREEAGGGWAAARCLCPVGWKGTGCSQLTEAEVPELSGLSYLALPTLQNAYSDLHLALDFRPTSWTGMGGGRGGRHLRPFWEK